MSFSFSLSARELGTRRISQIRNGMSWSKAGSGALAIITAARINGELENWVQRERWDSNGQIVISTVQVEVFPQTMN